MLFGGEAADAPSVRDEAGLRVVDLRTPVHAPGVVDVELQNLDVAGDPIHGESVVLAAGYRFARPTVAREAELTRVVRQLLRELKRQVLANVSATVSVDYDDTTLDGLTRTVRSPARWTKYSESHGANGRMHVIAMTKVPSLVLSGPMLRPNRFYSANVAHEDVVDGIAGPELAACLKNILRKASFGGGPGKVTLPILLAPKE